MALIPMIATRDFTWQGRAVRAGDYLDVTGAESLALRHSNKAKFAKSSWHTYQVADLQPVAEPAETPQPTRRRYRRRDLQAEE